MARKIKTRVSVERLATYIVARRTEKEETQEVAAVSAKLSVRTWRSLEAATAARPRLDVIERVAWWAGVTTSKLVERIEVRA
jgi:hypothetical protein